MVSTVVLAAGAGSRLGGNKLLADIGGEPLLRRVVREAHRAELGPVLAVVPPGAPGELLRAALAGCERCAVLENPSPELGMNGSLAVGVRALPAEATAALVLLGDMPFVTADQLRLMAERWRVRGAPLVASRYGGVLAPPMLFDRRLFPELSNGPAGDGQGRAVTHLHLPEAEILDWPPEALADIDDPADLAAARDHLAKEERP